MSKTNSAPHTDQQATSDTAYLPISEYGVIGNLHTAALVSRTGSIDFLAFPRFDSPTVFAALLDQAKGGRWSIEALDGAVNHQQLYYPDTAILFTRYLCEGALVEIADFMPPKVENNDCVILRRVHCLHGSMRLRSTLQPAFDYARKKATVERVDDHLHFAAAHDPTIGIELHSAVEWTLTEDGTASAEFELQEDEQICFILRAHSDPADTQLDIETYTTESWDTTVAFWQQWVGQIKYTGRYIEKIRRSAITLKLLTSVEYGSTVAAATFGLPEIIGGERNWDYRYTWIRDSAFVMYAFLRLGLYEETEQFIHWIVQRCEHIAEATELQLMYGVDGRNELTETTLDHLEGYRQSSPVRIGNAAYEQLQMDIYGDLIDTVYLFNKYSKPITYKFWKYIDLFVEFVRDNWRRKDHGIWEVRGEKQEFLNAKIMCWVAIDRGIRIAVDRSFPAPIEEWRRTRDEIYEDVYDNYWNEEKQAFVQYRGSDTLDAAALLMPLTRMISPDEERWKSTMVALEKELVFDTLVYRYKLDEGADDGLEGEEGTFTICSFWYIEVLARMGQWDKARVMYDKVFAYANHLGLFSEEIGLNGEQLGNFPQAFTHLAAISTAVQLEKKFTLREEYKTV